MNAVMTRNGTLASRVPFEDYLAIAATSISALKELKRSPQHYRWRLANPLTSAPLTLGRAAHCAVLEPERYASQFAVWDRRTPAGNLKPRNSAEWEGFKAAHEGQEILTEDEHLHAMAIGRAVRADSSAARYLEEGEPEVTMQWEMQGRKCRGRIDWLTRPASSPVLVGLKTTTDCRPFHFGKQAATLGYHMQWAWYNNGYQVIKDERPALVEIVVESKPPYAVAVYTIPDDVLLQGEEEALELLGKLSECELRNSWPGPVPVPEDISLPSWAYKSEDITGLELE
jgi:hypothetical protein